MGAIKKDVRSSVRNNARMVFVSFYKERGIKKTKNQINDMVKKAEKAIVHKIMAEIK